MMNSFKPKTRQKCKYCNKKLDYVGDSSWKCPCCHYWTPIIDEAQQMRICKHIEIVKKINMSKLYKRTDKCPKGHKMKKTGISGCDDVFHCKCGSWLKYCFDGPLVKL